MTTALLHPQTTEDQRVLRWSTGGRLLAADCDHLSTLVDDGILESFETTPGEVRTRLADGRSWRADGGTVRSALHRALSTPCQADDLTDEELLRAIQDLLQHQVDPVAASHGGVITAHSVRDGVLTIELAGACRGCPAAGRTMSALVASRVQAYYPHIHEVRAVQPPRRLWGSLPWARERK